MRHANNSRKHQEIRTFDNVNKGANNAIRDMLMKQYMNQTNSKKKIRSGTKNKQKEETKTNIRRDQNIRESKAKH